ncbi:DNA polymerase III PolC-type [Marinomonas gallaica]|uniref:DNA polymerase III PolC-type n=1 Tax=Marinomonas gallaica TaxID=1806667 RepID=A0A1C3JR45_9GAMM|nr:3'-5' exonuclease [Marinomonas gallaica]SBT17520.1 DNA polymerase III PolC-type [Marinomonas gallaica]SBT19712.1 DNA polymerase III PolC-type [Marinomonas gallaica]
MARGSDTFSWHEFIRQEVVSVNSPLLKSFYASQNFPEDLTLDQAEYVALDFETTGLDPKTDEIVSIGLVPFNLKRIKVAEAKHWIVRPKCKLSDDSIVIHGITHSEVSAAPRISEVLEQVLKALEGKVVVVHYQYIERQFLNRAVEGVLGEELWFPMLDTMRFEAMLYRDGWRTKLKRLFGSKLVSIRLVDSRLRYGLPRYHMHSAVTDAIATAELLQAQIRHRFDESVRVTDLWQ